MNGIDIVILLCFIPALIHGISKGFIAQAAAIISLLAGAWLSFKFSNAFAVWMKQFADISGVILQIVAFIVILVAVSVLFHLLGKALSGFVRLIMLGWMDRILGIAFAFVKIFLVAGLLVLLFDTLNSVFELANPELLAESVFYEPLKDTANIVFPYIKQIIFNQ